MKINVSYIYDTDTKAIEADAEGRTDVDVFVTALGEDSLWLVMDRSGVDGGQFRYDPEPTDQLDNIALRAAAELMEIRRLPQEPEENDQGQ